MHHISPCPLLTLSGLFTSPAMVGVTDNLYSCNPIGRNGGWCIYRATHLAKIQYSAADCISSADDC